MNRRTQFVCRGGSNRQSRFPALATMIALVATSVAFAQKIPDRPEKLKFPPLSYEPPAPEQFRVKLKSGPVAYVVPDRELPLVNIAVYAHTDDYLVPESKEGLAYLTGYLLALICMESQIAD